MYHWKLSKNGSNLNVTILRIQKIFSVLSLVGHIKPSTLSAPSPKIVLTPPSRQKELPSSQACPSWVPHTPSPSPTPPPTPGPRNPVHLPSGSTSGSTQPFLAWLPQNLVYNWALLLFHLFIYFIYLFLAALGLCCCARAFSSCGEQGLLFVAVRRLLTAVAFLVAEHGL